MARFPNFAVALLCLMLAEPSAAQSEQCGPFECPSTSGSAAASKSNEKAHSRLQQRRKALAAAHRRADAKTVDGINLHSPAARRLGVHASAADEAAVKTPTQEGYRSLYEDPPEDPVIQTPPLQLSTALGPSIAPLLSTANSTAPTGTPNRRVSTMPRRNSAKRNTEAQASRAIQYLIRAGHT